MAFKVEQNSFWLLFNLTVFCSFVKSFVYLRLARVSILLIVITDHEKSLWCRIDRFGILLVSYLLELKLFTSNYILNQLFCDRVIQIFKALDFIRYTRFYRVRGHKNFFIISRIYLKVDQVFCLALWNDINKIYIDTLISSTTTYTLISHLFVHYTANRCLINSSVFIISFQME